MFGMTYQWRDGSRMAVDAQVAGEAIETLRLRSNGDISPAQVVDVARNPRHELHPAFEWDDTVAAEGFRREQARHLIGALVVTVKPMERQRDVRAFVSVTRDKQVGYTSLHAAMSDKELRRQVLTRAWTELQAWRERYAGYSELAEMHAAIDNGAKVHGN